MVFSRGSRAVTEKKCTKKREARATLLFCLVKLWFLFLISRRRRILNFALFTIHFDQSETEFSQRKLSCPANSIRNVFRLIGSSFVSG